MRETLNKYCQPCEEYGENFFIKELNLESGYFLHFFIKDDKVKLFTADENDVNLHLFKSPEKLEMFFKSLEDEDERRNKSSD